MVRTPVLKEEYRVEAVCILLTEVAATLQAETLDGFRFKVQGRDEDRVIKLPLASPTLNPQSQDTLIVCTASVDSAYYWESEATEHGKAVLCRELQRLGKLKKGLGKRYQFMIGDHGFRFRAEVL